MYVTYVIQKDMRGEIIARVRKDRNFMYDKETHENREEKCGI